MTAPALWYFSRATGIVSLLLLTLVMVLGIAVAGRATAATPARAFVAGLHRVAALMSVCFLGLHIATAVLDSYVDIGWISVLVPFTSGYEPVWVGLGTAAFDLILALVATSLLRTRLGRRRWRAVHWAAYALWPIAFVHGLTAGPDLGSGLLLWVSLAAAATVVGATGWRWSVATRPGDRAGAVAAAVDSERRRSTALTGVRS